jgi:adenylosuccinate lyase
VEAGLARPEAYGVVQRLALQAADEGASFRALVEADPAVTATLSPEVLERCFDDRLALRHVDTVLARLESLDR